MATETEDVLELKQRPPTFVENDLKAEIRRVDASTLSYDDFYWQYMYANCPVILTNISNDWPCRLNWTRGSCNRNEADTIDFDYLRTRIGNLAVPVANCRKEYYDSHEKIEMRFFEFLDYWQRSRVPPTPGQSNRDPNSPTEDDILYLKDWHLQATMPDYDFYQVPKYFASDWLNEKLLATGSDDYRFVYMGPKHTWTPFHADVFGSFSWSTNIVGTKKWLLLPPGEEQKLTDKLDNKPFSIDERLLHENGATYFVVHQEANESIFVPSGWYHQVLNVSDTISVNHNWFNACNIGRIWTQLTANMRKVTAAIEDCRQMDNFDEHCQTMLRASFGMNYLDFLDTLEFIATRRLRAYDNENNAIIMKGDSDELRFFTSYKPNEVHVRHDLQTIRSLVGDMLHDEVIANARHTLYRRCMRLSELLRDIS